MGLSIMPDRELYESLEVAWTNRLIMFELTISKISASLFDSILLLIAKEFLHRLTVLSLWPSHVTSPSAWSVFAVRMNKAPVLSYPFSAQWRLIRLGGCPGWSESLLGAQSSCWFCHIEAHLLISWLLISGRRVIHVKQRKQNPEAECCSH